MISALDPQNAGDKRDRLRREIGLRIKKVRKLYDENRTRYVENFVKGDKGTKPVHHTTWKGWEDGTSLADVEVMVVFCDSTGSTLDWIYRGILDGVDEDLKLRMFEDDKELLAWYRADRASRRGEVEAATMTAPSAKRSGTVEGAVPEAPKRGRRRPGRRQLPEKNSA